jgi:HemY protein
MYRSVLFLLLVAAAAAGAAWVADQPGNVALSWNGWRVETSLAVFALALSITIVAAMLLWSFVRVLWRAPAKMRHRRRERRRARGRHAITHGLLAIGHGDATAARAHADAARRHAGDDPLALLLHAQSAQLLGDSQGANAAFRAMAEREDTRLLGLRGLFIEAQRADDPVGAVMIAEEALKLSPASSWASHAVLGFRCAKGDWSGALAILDNNFSARLIDRPAYRRQRAVLLTARALETESSDRDLSRSSVMEAIKLAPTLVPAAVLASKYESEAHRVRHAMRIVEAAWVVHPHPDLADAYAHVRLGDSARERLGRVESLAAKAPGHLESALALARAAIDASEFGRAREALASFVGAPTQRVAMLMAEVERNEHGDSGRARAWTLRAVRALHDPAWTADGYVSDRWRPVSPVSGRLDAFQWQTPVAALPSDKRPAIEMAELEEAASALPQVEAPRQDPAEVTPPAQDNLPGGSPAKLTVVESVEPGTTAAASGAAAEVEAAITAPLFRQRNDLAKPETSSVPAVIPIVRPPDDPGIEDDEAADEYREQQVSPAHSQAGGWRGFLSRWGG